MMKSKLKAKILAGVIVLSGAFSCAAPSYAGWGSNQGTLDGSSAHERNQSDDEEVSDLAATDDDLSEEENLMMCSRTCTLLSCAWPRGEPKHTVDNVHRTGNTMSHSHAGRGYLAANKTPEQRQWEEKLGIDGLGLIFKVEFDFGVEDRNVCDEPVYTVDDEHRRLGYTMLHEAAKRGDVDAFVYYELLHAYGYQCLRHFHAALYVKNSDGDTPLHVAVRCGNTEVVRYILDFMEKNNVNPGDTVSDVVVLDRSKYPEGIDFNLRHFLQLRNNRGETPLDLARMFLRCSTVKFVQCLPLAEQGDTQMSDRFDKLAADVCKDDDMVELLERYYR